MTDKFIAELCGEKLEAKSHGPIESMGVDWRRLPTWDDLEFACMPADPSPQSDVGTGLVLGEDLGAPLAFDIPLMVSDMSFGSLSKPAKIALARGAELAGAGMCSGEGGILAEEIAESKHYLFELGTGEFGYAPTEYVKTPRWHGAQAFHFKGGQAAKTGTGGHLPKAKVTQEIADTRGCEVGKDVISPPTFRTLGSIDSFKERASSMREKIGAQVPFGYKLSAQHLKADIEFALEIGVSYIILDGRGGSTGAAPVVFRDHISMPTIPALLQARRIIDEAGATDRVKLIITGGLRVPTDFAKALALGADGVALANSVLQAIGCFATRRCGKNLCRAGIATQNEDYIDEFTGKPEQVRNFLVNSVRVMQALAEAHGHRHLRDFRSSDLVTRSESMARLTGVRLREA